MYFFRSISPNRFSLFFQENVRLVKHADISAQLLVCHTVIRNHMSALRDASLNVPVVEGVDVVSRNNHLVCFYFIIQFYYIFCENKGTVVIDKYMNYLKLKKKLCFLKSTQKMKHNSLILKVVLIIDKKKIV